MLKFNRLVTVYVSNLAPRQPATDLFISLPVHCIVRILFWKTMSRTASATGLIEARIRPVYRPKPKKVELSGSTKPVSFVLRPFSGLFNPYPYGCSVLCNHPADCEAKEVLRRAKDSWATEGKALLLPEEMEMIRANLVAAGSATETAGIEAINTDEATVPEELFRKYTETDSRPLTPAPTLASGPVLTSRPMEEFSVTCNPRERTTLVLDLRTNTRKQENDTFTWHALTLEPPPSHRKTEIFVSKPKPSRYHSRLSNNTADDSNLFPTTDNSELDSSVNIEREVLEKMNKEQPAIIRRRGKRLRKGKCRRGSTYGQQTEVRDLFEPTDTQISHIGDASRRTSIHTANGDTDPSITPKKASAITNIPSTMLPSFLEPDILKHLCRELDSDKMEAEFSVRRKIALEEALRVKGESYSRSRRSQTYLNPALINTPRVFSRQVARFEILDSESLRGLTVLDYLSKHVFVSSGRKSMFGRVFNKFQDDTRDVKKISPNNIPEALEEVIGKAMSEEQETYLKSLIGEINEPLNFRSWCGLCAAAERFFCPLPQKEVDPANWLERVDFETLERRLGSVEVDPKLVVFLREIRDK